MRRRLVYLYVSTGFIPMEMQPTFDATSPTTEPFADLFAEEGNYPLFRRLIELGTIDEALVVIESPRAPGSRALWNGTIKILVVPNIEFLWPILSSRRYQNIIWCRHGQKWFAFLEKWHNAGGWLLFYRAAGNRQNWPFWDIILDDLFPKVHIVESDLPKLIFPFSKPVNPRLFYPEATPRIYDLCVGASHIHDKKGQWMIAPILDEYANRYAKTLNCIMPGSFYHSANTNKLLDLVKGSTIHLPYRLQLTGMVPREMLRTIYNQSKLFIHMGAAGQNDRSVLEAMACGTPVAIANPDYHPKFVSGSPYSFIIDPQRPWVCVRQIDHALKLIDETWRERVTEVFSIENGLERVVIPKMERLLSLVFDTKHSERRKLYDRILAEGDEMRRQA